MEVRGQSDGFAGLLFLVAFVFLSMSLSWAPSSLLFLLLDSFCPLMRSCVHGCQMR
jgi:hypothetical protein